MPLAPPGTRGYTDWQRIENWDDAIAYGHDTQPIGAGELSDIFDTSRYAYLGGFDQLVAGQALVALGWFADIGGTVNVGGQEFTLDSRIIGTAQYRIPHRGPFFGIQWLPLNASNPTHKVQLFNTNRPDIRQFVPSESAIISRQDVNVNAGATDTVYPTDYYAGPVQLALNVNGGPWAIIIRCLSTAGVWEYIDEITATNSTAEYKKVMPSGAWRIEATNGGGGANTYYMTVTPSTTGAT